MIQQSISVLQAHINKMKKLIRKPQFEKSWVNTQELLEKIKQQHAEHIQLIIQDGQPIEEEKKAPPAKSKAKELNVGIEFDNSIKTEDDLIEYIIKHFYFKVEVYMSASQINEFSEVYNKVDEIDSRNIGSIIGMAMLGFIGFIALGFTVIGVIAGGVLGVIMGRYAGKRLKRQLRGRRNKLVELDIFDIKLRCYVKWVKAQLIKYRYNINQIRFIVEKLFLEVFLIQKFYSKLKPILHYKKFSKSQQKIIKEVIEKVYKLIKQPELIATLQLSFKLGQEYFRILQCLNKSQPNLVVEQNFGSNINDLFSNMSSPQQIQEVRLVLEINLIKVVDNVLKPLITITQDFKLKKGMLKQLQGEVEKFLLQPAIIHLGQQCPDPQMSLEFIKLFAEKMKCPVNTGNLKKYLKDLNYRDLEMMGRLIQQEGKYRQISQYPTDRSRKSHRSKMNEVLEQEENQEQDSDESDNDEIEEEHNQVDQDALQIQIQQFVNRTTYKILKINEQSNVGLEEEPKEEQKEEPQKIANEHESHSHSEQQSIKKMGSSMFQINKDEHPNNIITKQILQLPGDELLANFIPLKKLENSGQEQRISSQRLEENDLKKSKVSMKQDDDHENKKSRSPKKKKSDVSSEQKKLVSQIELDIQQPFGQFQEQFNETQYDQQTLQKFNNMIDFFNESLATWENVTKSDNIFIYKTMKPGKSNVFVRGNALLPGVNIETAFRAIYQQDFRQAWDKILRGFHIVASESELVDIVFYYVPPPIPIVATREFLQKRVLRKNFPEKNQITLLFYSVEHENQPIKKGNVRAATELAGYLFKEEQGGSSISFLSNNDVKGSVPKLLVNYASAKAPFTWFGNLRKACLLYQQFNGDLTKVKIK